MDLCQQCLYCSKTYFYIRTYIACLCHDQKERILYICAEQLPDDDFAIKHESILYPSIHELHRHSVPHPSDNDPSDTVANSDNACIDPEQPPFRTRIYSTPHLDNRLAGKPISNEYFDIFDGEIDPRSPFLYEEEYRLALWRIRHNLSRAAINKLFRNPTMATVSNFTLSHTVFKRLHEMSYAMGIDWWKCVTIVWMIQTTCVMKITHISFTPILLNALSSSCNSLCSGNICCMLQQRNSMMLRNISTQGWNKAIGGGMNRYISWISSWLRQFWPLQ